MPLRDKEKKREYQRQYYLANREHALELSQQNYFAKQKIIVEHRRQYCLINKDRIAEENRQKRLAGKERRYARTRQYCLDHKEKVVEYQRQYRLLNKKRAAEWGKQYYLAKKEKIAEYNRIYRIEHPDEIREKDRRHKVLRRGVAVFDLTLIQWQDILTTHDFRCKYCGIRFSKETPPTQDHVVPLSRGGAHTASNIVPACLHCNCSKGARIISA